jgi:Leucine rich repeat
MVPEECSHRKGFAKVANLSNLCKFGLSHCNFLCEFFHSRSCGPRFTIEFLQLSQNSFTGEFPDVMGHHWYLVVLDLVMNQFEGELPSSFASLPCLGRLLLEGNRFSGKIPKAISHLKSLKHLYIQKNEFISTIPDIWDP